MNGRSSSAPSLLLYGANGYTARLLIPELRARGIEPILAGRNGAAIRELASSEGLPSRVFALDEPGEVDAALANVHVVLNAAGPFGDTAQPLIDGCLRQRVDYLDLSGEVSSLGYAAQCGELARRCGIMLLPAVGFDVVPSDCLALHLAQRLPGADWLRLHVSPSNLLSRGSATTLAQHAGQWVQVRRDRVLEPVRFRTQTRWTDFGKGPRAVVAVSWGDLVTAFHTTGIPNIEVYFEATAFRWSAVTSNQLFGVAFRSGAARAMFERFVDLVPSGPAAAARDREQCVIVGEIHAGRQSVRSRLVTSEAYTFTARAGARIARLVIDGARRAGFQTPARLFGADFVLQEPGVTREDIA